MGRRDVELMAKKKSGLEFPVDISILNLNTSKGNFAFSILKDLSGVRNLEDDLFFKFSLLMG
jgi:hypothetical protein